MAHGDRGGGGGTKGKVGGGGAGGLTVCSSDRWLLGAGTGLRYHEGLKQLEGGKVYLGSDR